MDFNDERSIYSNSQLALDNLQGISQNDYLHFDDAHVMQYFVNEPLLNVPNQYEQQHPQAPPSQNVLCSNQQTSSNPLKAQNTIHSSQPNLNPNQSRNLNTAQHHSPYPQQTTQQSHNPQFHNQAPTSKQQFISNVPINQQINYVNIPNKDNNKSIIYSEVVNCNNAVLNNPNCNVYNNVHNGINHQQQIHQQQRQLQSQPQQINLTNNLSNSLMQQQQQQQQNKNQPVYSNEVNLTSNNNLPSINKNGNNHLNDSQLQKSFYSPPPPPQLPNYYNCNSSSQTINNNNLQPTQQPNNSCFIDKKSTINGNGMNNNYFNNNNNSEIKSLITRSPIIDKIVTQPETTNNNINNISNSSLNSFNSSSINSPLNNVNSPNNNNNTPNKSQTNELNNSLTVNQETKQKAETKTIIIFKIIDRIVYNGNVVKETIIKDDEIVKSTGFIDWSDNNKTDQIETTPTTATNSTISSKKCTTTIKVKNLKRCSSVQNKDNKEKKSKVEIDTKLTKNDSKIDQITKSNNSSATKSVVKETESINSNKFVKETKPETNLEKNNSVSQNKDVQPKIIISDSKEQQTQQQTASKQMPDTLFKYEFEDPIFKPIDVGQKVIAKWTDKNWYSGRVLTKEADSKWRIGFDDGGRRLVRENEILSVEFLPKGQQVMVIINYSASYCSKGIIKSHRYDETNNERFYLIEYGANMKSAESEFSSKDVFLTAEHALSLLNRRKQTINDSKFADVDLNNIIPKRSRISNKNLNDTSNSNSSSVINDKLTTEFDNDNDSNSNLSCSTTNSSATNGSATKKSSTKKNVKAATKQIHNLTNEDTESSIQNLNVSNSKKTTSSSNDEPLVDSNSETNDRLNDDLNKLNDSFDDNLIGPIPKISSQLFKSFAFLLSFEDHNKQNDDEAGYSIPFDIDHLTKQIQNGSGLILNKFEDIKDNYQVVLVSHSYLKTDILRLMCLSSGIPCIKFTWVIDSCKSGQLLKKEDYILPTGFSLLTNNLLQDRNIYKKSQSLFKNTKILLTSSNSELTDKWLPLFNASKAVLLDNLPDTSRKPNCADFVVTDSTCNEEIVKKANSLKIPIVSIDYIIQCLIHGKRLPVDAHKSFQYNYIQTSS